MLFGAKTGEMTGPETKAAGAAQVANGAAKYDEANILVNCERGSELN